MDTTDQGRGPNGRIPLGSVPRSLRPRPAVLITGGSHGVGRAVTLRFAQAGHPVILTYRGDPVQAQALACGIAQRQGRALALPLDIRDHTEIAAVFQKSAVVFGPIGVVVNTTGISCRAVPLTAVEPQEIETVIDTNILGTVLVSAQAVRHMALSAGGNGGVIINISAVPVRSKGMSLHVPQATSVGAVEALTRSLSDEVAPDGIRVVAVAPALEGHRECVGPTANRSCGAGVITAEDIADAVFFLASDQARAITGTILTVSG